MGQTVNPNSLSYLSSTQLAQTLERNGVATPVAESLAPALALLEVMVAAFSSQSPNGSSALSSNPDGSALATTPGVGSGGPMQDLQSIMQSGEAGSTLASDLTKWLENDLSVPTDLAPMLGSLLAQDPQILRAAVTDPNGSPSSAGGGASPFASTGTGGNTSQIPSTAFSDLASILNQGAGGPQQEQALEQALERDLGLDPSTAKAIAQSYFGDGTSSGTPSAALADTAQPSATGQIASTAAEDLTNILLKDVFSGDGSRLAQDVQSWLTKDLGLNTAAAKAATQELFGSTTGSVPTPQ